MKKITVSLALFASLCAGPVATADPTLIAHFPLDADGNSADGTFVAALEEDVEFGQAGANAGTGTAALFNGASSRIQHDWDEALNPTSFTLTAWAKSEGGAGTWNSVVTSRHDLNPDSQGYIIYDTQPGGVWTFWSGNGLEPGNWQTMDGPEVKLGEWEHLAITYDDELQVKELFVDGESVAMQEDIVEPNDTTPFNIGSGQDFGDGFWFDGLLDDIGLWDGALTQEQIQQVMNGGVTSLGADPGLQTPASVVLDLDGSVQMLTTIVRNSGQTEDLIITGIPVSGADADKFTITAELPITLAPEEQAEVGFTFDPAGATGAISATFIFESNDSQTEEFVVSVTGLIRDPKIEVAAALEFGSVGAPTTKAIEVKNLGATKPLNIGEVTVSGTSAANFSVTSKPGSIPVGGTGTIEIVFDPQGLEGGFSAALQIASDAPGAAAVSVALSASVEVTNPLVAFWPLDADGTSADGKYVPALEEDVEFGQSGARPFTGSSAAFNGASSRIQFDHTLDLNPESFTLTVWARSEGGAGAWNSVVTSRNDLNPDSEGFIIYDSQPAGDWRFWNGNGDDPGNWIELTGPEVRLEEWEHLAIRYDDSIMEKALFIDGELFGTQEARVAPNQEKPFNIGSGQDFGDGFWFQGNIDDMALFRTALSDEDVQFIFENGVLAFQGGVETFQITGIEQAENHHVTLTWTSRTGADYTLERSDDLSTWLELADGIPSEGEETTFTDDTVEPDATVHYYRVRKEG